MFVADRGLVITSVSDATCQAEELQGMVAAFALSANGAGPRRVVAPQEGDAGGDCEGGARYAGTGEWWLRPQGGEAGRACAS